MIEDQSFQSRILRSNPTLRFLEQAARFSRSMPEDLRKAILDPDSTDKLQKYMDSIRDRRAMIRTTTAVDIVSGGDKGEPNMLSISISNARTMVPDG